MIILWPVEKWKSEVVYTRHKWLLYTYEQTDKRAMDRRTLPFGEPPHREKKRERDREKRSLNEVGVKFAFAFTSF